MKFYQYYEVKFLLATSIIFYLLSLKYPKFRKVMLTNIIFLMVLFIMYRSPNRDSDLDNKHILSPCDGYVFDVEETENYKKVSIFIPINGVHVQYAPTDGKIVDLQHKAGKFHLAYKSKYKKNERVEIKFYSNPLEQEIDITLYAGRVARRIKPYVEPGDTVERSDKIGIIKFGSRDDIVLPTNTEILIKEGDYVYGGLTGISKIQ